MNKQAILHIPESNFCFAKNGNEMVIRIRTDKNDGFEQINLIYGIKYSFNVKRSTIQINKRFDCGDYFYYQVTIRLDDFRFVYLFEIVDKGTKYYYCEDGILENYDFNYAYFNCFQYPYINKIDIMEEHKFLKNTVMYHIFPDRFYRNDLKKDSAYINRVWGEKPKKSDYFGGDLKGIIAKLPYLKDLGVNMIYMTPIFLSPSYHKYDTIDYYKVDPQLGTEETLKELIKEIHRTGMKIIFDGVFNHISYLSHEFQDCIKKGSESKYYNWFIINGQKVNIKNKNYETFSDVYYMPKLNTSNLEVQDFIIKIIRHYIKDYGIDGWRLDVSDELSHSVLRNIRSDVKKVKEDVFIFGENWHDSFPFLQGDQLDSIINYAFTKLCIDYFVNQVKDAGQAAEQLNALQMRYSEQVNNMMVNVLDNHDTDRFYSLLKENDSRLLCALSLLFFYVGVPCIYYGTEIPLSGGYDPDNRKCFPWDKLDQNSVHFKILSKLISLKKDTISKLDQYEFLSSDGMLVIRRYNQDQKLILYLNQTSGNKVLKHKKILLSNNYENGILKKDGFIIAEEK